MKVYYCTSFKGIYPVGTAAVVVAEGKEEAIELLETHLAQEHLPQTITREQLVEIPTSMPSSHILCNGDY